MNKDKYDALLELKLLIQTQEQLVNSWQKKRADYSSKLAQSKAELAVESKKLMTMKDELIAKIE